MEERFIVTCRSTSGWLLLLLIFTNGYLAQKNATPNTNSGWTFSREESFVAFSPNLTLEQDQEIMFSFRTRSPNGLLFCHLVEHFNQSVHPLLRNYHFCAELSHGYLLVKYSLNQISDVMNLGRALNDDSWHSVDIFLETTSGKLVVSLDDLPSKSIYLRAYTQFTDVRAILDWTRLRSVVSFAGLTHAVAVEHHQFIGCLRSLKYRELIEVTWEVSPTIVMQATPGCQDLCQGENPCGEGRCVIFYTSVHCDCSSLDREGDKCQNSNITALTLHGYEWLTYQLYSEEEKTLRDRNRFSLQFKSDRGSGVLLYAVGSMDAGGSLEQHHSHVIASVHQGTVKASVAFGDNILEQTMGIGVDDSRWHNLTIVHEKVKVEFYLDGEPYVQKTINDMYYLGLDPIIYIGGGKNFVQTLGLQVRQNFVGCLKNVYVNEHSVLYELRNNHSTSQLHGNTDIQYGCHRVTNISLTFPKSKSILYLSGYYDSTFSIQFDFRTVRETAILLSAKIQTIDSFGYTVKGFFEVWINNTLPMMKFVRSMYYDSLANITKLHVSVSDNQWHTLSFQLKDGQVKISVDSLSLPSLSIGNGSTIDNTIEIGYGYSRIYADHVGFVGCIRNLVIQKQFLDPINLMERPPTGGYHSGLILDGCKLVNHCLVHQHCQHGGRCLSDWDGVSCDCSSSAYQGKYCQFSKFQKSCDSYYQSGWRSSGVYVIDVDGSGPVEPTHVSCQMGIRTEGDYYGQTVVEHNLRNLTKVRGTTLPDIRLRLTYRGMGFVQLQQLTKISTWCEQYVQYKCLNAPIGLGNLTNFKSIDGGVVQYIGETDAVFTPGCSKGSCNCDNGNLVAQEDSGFNRVKSQLPIGEVTVYQYTDYTTPDSEATLTIGPLKCWGNTESITSSSVTFVTENSFLKLPGWVYGDLEFSFRTHQREALLLYQSSSNGDWFKVTLEAEDSIKMEMQIKGKMILRKSLDADKPVNDGDWHRVTLELSSHEVRCGLDSQREIIAIPFHNNITFDGLLYLGGKLYDHGSYNNLPGLSGCVKGLVYNGKLRNLTYDVYDDMPNILSGCRPHCSPDPCQNGAQCVEMWNDYRCICTNEWAHSGQSCETNINKNAVTINGDSTAFFDLRVSSNPLEMEEKIIFSFRTQMYGVLIFYMYDEFNNFIQLEVTEDKKLRFTRNNFQQIFYKDIEVPGIIEATWKQVVLDPTKIIVDGKVTFLGLSNNKIESGYSTDPFANEEETVKPPRPAEKLPPFLRLYLAGTPENVTTMEKYVGCIRGFKIGDHLIDLQKNSQGIAGINTGCKKGCNVNQCLNGGLCKERWGEGQYECDCSQSNFAGKHCELEASGKFTGQSVVHYKFVPYGEAAKTNTEQFSFIFKTNCLDKTMVLLLIFSETKGDYIMISLSTTFVRALWKQGNNLFEEKLKGNFCDGTAHKFMYKREGEEMWIKVDQSHWREKFTTRTYLENMNMVLVGGLIPELTVNMEQKYGDSNQTVNFTGCISEVTYTPVMRESNIVVQPMKELRDLKNGSIIVHGPEVPQCSPVDYHDPSETTVPTTHTPTTTGHPTHGVTMPPWSIGGPEVYVIGKGNNFTTPGPTITTTPTTTTSTTTELVTTAMFFPTTEQGPTNVTLVLGQMVTDTVPYITIFIVSSVLTLMCLVSVLIAVVMRRLRKRYVTYDVRKKYLDDYEMKEPLNHSMEMYSPAPPPPKKDIHIATWDEFSMVSATLGSNKKKQNGIAPGKVHTLPADLRNTDYPVQTTFLPEDGVKYPVYNRKKNRPASSISEVLEEMERQQKAKELGVDPEQYEDPKSHGEGELEWDPLVDRTPLTLGIHHDTIYETQDEDSDGASRATSSESEDPLKVLDQQEDLLQEYNGDSGYEAESQRNGDDDLDLGESLTPPTPDSSKLYYDITGVTESPKCPPRSYKLIIESEEQFV